MVFFYIEELTFSYTPPPATFLSLKGILVKVAVEIQLHRCSRNAFRCSIVEVKQMHRSLFKSDPAKLIQIEGKIATVSSATPLFSS